MFVKNASARIITIGSVSIPCGAVAELEHDEKSHKGLAEMLEKSYLVKSDAKEYKAFVDPEGAKADAEAAAAEAAEKAKK